jgi:hypothetical protein
LLLISFTPTYVVSVRKNGEGGRASTNGNQNQDTNGPLVRTHGFGSWYCQEKKQDLSFENDI